MMGLRHDGLQEATVAAGCNKQTFKVKTFKILVLSYSFSKFYQIVHFYSHEIEYEPWLETRTGTHPYYFPVYRHFQVYDTSWSASF